jgi:polyisoprenoid-binding protein YceI
MNSLSASVLKSLLDTGHPIILLHVLPDEHFPQQHLPGALNACVYEMAFLSTVAELVPDKYAEIIVYGAGSPSLDSAVAVEKLVAAGYSQVRDFRGGLTEWISHGFATEGRGLQNESAGEDGTYSVDAESSVVRWTGRNLFNHHNGTVKLAGGQIEVENGVLKAARFSLDMRSIACEDLTDANYNALLIRHLHDADFFDVANHPTADFIAEKAEPISGCTEGIPNYHIHGHLTVRGITRPLSFPAVIATADPHHLTAQAQIEIDRTDFGSLYGSGKFFQFLGKHVVNDHIQLHVKLQAARRQS